MNDVGNAIYFGCVTHKRLNPIQHALSYRVFSLLLDSDEFEQLGRRLRFFSHNRFNLISIYDRDYGNGTPLGGYLRGIAKSAGKADIIERFVMLCYPRVLGYVFNPLTLYYGLDAGGLTRLIIYEVTNTFRERKTYVLPAEPDESGQVWQQCPKQFFVSPFNKVSGTYSFRLSPITDDLAVGVTLKDAGKPILRAHFRGHRLEMTDRALVSAVMRTGFMTLVVMAGIHFEAIKLFWKGLRTQAKPPAPDAITYFEDPLSGRERDSSVQGARKADLGGVDFGLAVGAGEDDLRPGE